MILSKTPRNNVYAQISHDSSASSLRTASHQLWLPLTVSTNELSTQQASFLLVDSVLPPWPLIPAGIGVFPPTEAIGPLLDTMIGTAAACTMTSRVLLPDPTRLQAHSLAPEIEDTIYQAAHILLRMVKLNFAQSTR